MLLLVACTHAALQTPRGAGLFPFATYQHALKIVTGPPARTVELHGVVSYQPDKLRVVGLSVFGTTVFKIEEDFKTGNIRKEFFLEIVRTHEEKFMQIYALIRELLIAPKGSADFTIHGAHFVLTAPDDQAIYRKIHIEHPQFSVAIEVTDYEFH